VVVCEDGHTVRVWDTITGAPLTPPLRHAGAVYYAAFSQDGRWLITSSEDNTVRVWDAVTGEALTPLLKHARRGQRVSFSADGNRALLLQEGGMVSTWDLTLDRRPIAALLALVQVQACSRIDERQQGQGLTPNDWRASWENWKRLR
jgi:WD40 repeat protein